MVCAFKWVLHKLALESYDYTQLHIVLMIVARKNKKKKMIIIITSAGSSPYLSPIDHHDVLIMSWRYTCKLSV